MTAGSSVTTATLRGLARLVWINVGKARNPWFEVASSAGSYGEDTARWDRWNKLQLELCRELFGVVFREADPTEDLLSQALDFLDGR